MTLVATCITAQHVVQVSDRRLVWLNGPRAMTVEDDDQNKAVVVCNQLVIAYTGLAKLDGRKTDEWLLDVAREVNPYSPGRVCEEIARRATEAMQKILRPPPEKRHAFVVAGWANYGQPDGMLIPFISAISNAMDTEWKWTEDTAKTFTVNIISLRDQPFLVRFVGQPPNRATRQRLDRQLQQYVRRARTSEGYVQMLAQSIRETANVNQAVGSNLMAVSLPRSGLKSDFMMFTGNLPFRTNQPVAAYLPEASGTPVVYAPNVACEGGGMWGYSFKPLNDSGSDGIITAHITVPPAHQTLL